MVVGKSLRFMLHAVTVMSERKLEPEWVERTVREPDWVVVDPGDSEVTRFYRALPERGDRIMRVACVETAEEIRILSAYLDRGARRPT